MISSRSLKTIFAFPAILFLACKTGDPDFKYVPLKEMKYQEANIPEGTEIEILSFSGGRTCTTEITYFYQFIGINTVNGDTVRILTPCQKLDEKASPAKGTFTPWSKTSPIVEQVLKETGEQKLVGERSLVVFNKRQLEIEEGNYKTAIGTMGF